MGSKTMKKNAMNKKVTLGILSAFLSLNVIVGCAATEGQRPNDGTQNGLNVPKPNSNDSTGLYKYAQALERNGQEREAIDFYLQATQVQPGYLEAHIALAQLYTKFNRMEEAKVAYENVLKLDRTHPFIGDYKSAKLKYFSARNIAQNGEYERALKLLQDAPTGTPLDTEIRETKENWRKQLQDTIRQKIVEDKIQQASLLAYKGNYEKAIEELLTAPDADNNPIIQQKITRWKQALAEQRNTPSTPPSVPPTPVVQNPPQQTYTTSATRYITGDTVNMRTAPTLGANSITTLSQGTVVSLVSGQVVSASGYNWLQVRTNGGSTGWVATRYLSGSRTVPSTTIPTAPATVYRFVTGDRINIRTGPSISSAVLAKAVRNERVTLVSGQRVSANGYIWRPIQLVNGTRGWIASRFLSHTMYGGGAATYYNSNRGVTRYVTGDVVNVRSRASTNSAVLYRARNGQRVRVLSNPLRNGGYTWLKVQLPNGSTGWIASIYLRR